MTVAVRLATTDDAPIVRSVMLVAYAEYLGALPVESGAHTETIDDVIAAVRDGGAVIAKDGDRAVGSARFSRDDTQLYVGRVAVLPTHRRRGVASAMMRFMEGVAVVLGCEAVRIGVRDSLSSNMALYESLVYEVVAVEPHPRGPDRVWTMAKRLAR